MMAPQVGVMRLTRPLAATMVIAVTLVLYPNVLAIGAIIGVDMVARPEDDGTRMERTICRR